jgi:hypothetical protein
VLIRHLNKSGGGHAIYRGGGSIGIIGAARAAFLVARDPDDETGVRRIFAVTKSNLAAEPPALAYRLADDPSNGCARIEWEDEPTHHRAGDLLVGPLDEEDRTDRDAAVEWLIEYLTDKGGAAPAIDAVRAARSAGYSKTTLHRARKKAHVDTSKDGMDGGWIWTIDPETVPRRFREGSKGSSSQGTESTEPSTEPSDCAGCGQRLLLTAPGRNQCEACRIRAAS